MCKNMYIAIAATLLAAAPGAVAVPLSNYNTLTLDSASFTGPLYLGGDYLWRGAVSLPSPVSNPSFRLQGIGATTNLWGDSDAAATNLPVFGTAATGQPPITLSGSQPADQFVLTFNESNGKYSLKRTLYQDFSNISVTDTPGLIQDPPWMMQNATCFNTNANFNGNTLRLGGPGVAPAESFIFTSISGGLGSIGFWYRNLDDSDPAPGRLDFQLFNASINNWITVGTLSNIVNNEYRFHEFPFAFSGDVNVRLVWAPANNPGNAWIAVDDLTIERLSAYATVSGVAHSPVSPVFTNSVTVSATVTSGYTANLSITTRYRIGTNGTFSTVAMTNTTGNTWVTAPPIPRTIPGPVQYYVEALFNTPIGDGPFSMTGPSYGPILPQAYTNSDTLTGFTDFITAEGWPETGNTDQSITNNSGWNITMARLKALGFAGLGTPDAVWLNTINNPDNFVRSPWLDNGVGAVMLVHRVHGGTTNLNSGVLTVWESPNGTTWTPKASITNTTGINWSTNNVPLNITTGTYIGFSNTAITDSGTYFGIDKISLSYPLATVSFTHAAIHPYYPSGTDPVHITCEINSATAFSPAYGIRARVYYKTAAVTNWSGPIEMTGNGSTFITSTAIPAQPVGTTMHYHIESDFVGYNRFHDYSPMTDPPFPNVAPYAYTTRAYVSNYDELRLDTIGFNADMTRTGDRFWEGILHFTNTVDQPAFLIQGYGFYNGTNAPPGLSTLWGDQNARTNLPLAGQAVVGGIPILIPELARGQYVVRFDEGTRVYSVQRIAFQNFDTWPASENRFEESYDGDRIRQHTQDFSTWSESSLKPMTDVFEAGWTNVSDYPYSGSFPPELEAMTPAGFYKLYDGVIVTQLVGSAAMLIGTALSGEIRAAVPDSLGSFAFDARAASTNNDFRPAIYSDPQFTNVRITVSLHAFDLPTNTVSDTVANSFGRTYKSLIAGYLDDNNYYEVRLRQVNATQKRFELLRKIGGVTTPVRDSNPLAGLISVNDTFSLHIFRNSPTTAQLRVYVGGTSPGGMAINDSVPLITNGFGVGVSTMDAGVSLSSISVHEITNITQVTTNLLYVEDFTNGAPGWTDGGGVWTATDGTYRRPGYTGPPLGLTIDQGPGVLGPWSTMETITNITHSNYRRYSVSPQTATSIYMRIRHTDGAGHLIVDNIRSEIWRGSTTNNGGWMATNAWVTAGNPDSGLELRGTRALAGQAQFIETPVISNGVSIIAFDYKSVTGTNHLLSFTIDYKLTNFPGFLPLYSVTNNPTGWTPFSFSVEQELRPQIQKIRIRNSSTNPAAGLLLDNIVITEPIEIDQFTWWGYNALISGSDAYPLALLADNIKGAYLNNGASNDTGGFPYTNYYSHIQSPYLPDGIGEISFWHRAWDSTPSTIEIVAATNRYLPDDQWAVITNVPVSGSTFQYFESLFYDTSNRYVKLRVNTSTGTPGRVAIDNLLISAPFASNLQLKNLRTIPDVPRFHDSVRVSVDVHDLFFNPVITSMVVKVQQGTSNWGQFLAPTILNMVLTGVDEETLTYTYQTIEAIAPRAIDTVIQYQVEAGFGGFFTEGNTSPRQYTGFGNPAHYWPVDLNRNQPFQTPYYYSLSCLPGQVWINALNITDASTFDSPPAGQFVEIIGKANINVGKWRLESINTDYSTNAVYTLPNGAMIGEASNHYGYIVFGQDDIVGRDHDLTNGLPFAGGIQLVRSMGAVEHAVSYDDWLSTAGQAMANSPHHEFIYAGRDDDLFDAPLALVGYGSNRVDFTWWEQDNHRDFRIGTNNIDQTLVPWPDTSPTPPQSDYSGTVLINHVWRENDRMIVEISTQSANLTPVPWYTTNLVNAVWQTAPAPEWSRTGTVYSISSGVVTGAPRVFYSIVVTGTD